VFSQHRRRIGAPLSFRLEFHYHCCPLAGAPPQTQLQHFSHRTVQKLRPFDGVIARISLWSSAPPAPSQQTSHQLRSSLTGAPNRFLLFVFSRPARNPDKVTPPLNLASPSTPYCCSPLSAPKNLFFLRYAEVLRGAFRKFPPQLPSVSTA